MTLKELSAQLKESRELLITAGAIIAMIFGGYWWLQDSIRDRDIATVEKYSELLSEKLIEKIVEKIDPVNTDDFLAAIDTLLYMDAVNAATDEALHMRTLTRQDEIVLKLESIKTSEVNLNVRLDSVQAALDRIMGVSRFTRQESLDRALTDSLQNELILIRQEKYNRDRMRQMEEQHRKEIEEIRGLNKDTVIDKGRRKAIRRTPRKQDRNRFKYPL